jgi:3D (Asp-Asp-Asp) domain-containing protein
VNKQQNEKEQYLVATDYYHPEEDKQTVKKQQKEEEVYLFATGYYHPEEDQNCYATGSYEEDLELNGRGITASGKKVKKGHAAVDTSVIPLGTEFYSEEHGVLKAEDTGGRIKGNRIDIFTGDGKRGLIKALKINGWVKLKILKWGNEKSSDGALVKKPKIQLTGTSPRNKIQ